MSHASTAGLPKPRVLLSAYKEGKGLTYPPHQSKRTLAGRSHAASNVTLHDTCIWGDVAVAAACD